MKKYGVAFHHTADNKCYCGVGFIKCQYDTLKEAREYARNFNNANIYRLEWTENGNQAVKKLKVIY